MTEFTMTMNGPMDSYSMSSLPDPSTLNVTKIYTDLQALGEDFANCSIVEPDSFPGTATIRVEANLSEGQIAAAKSALSEYSFTE